MMFLHAAFVFLVCTPWAMDQAQGSHCCTAGFPSLDQILTANETVFSPTPILASTNQGILVFVQQGIFPSLRITCSGTLTRFVYSASSEGSNQPANEFFDVWRRNDTNPSIANLILPPPRRTNEELVRNIGEDVALYSLDVNISVQVDDFIGFASFERTLLRFQLLDEGNEPVSFFRVPGNAIDLEREVPDGPYFPLITVIISPSSVVCPETTITSVPITISPTSTLTTAHSTPVLVSSTEMVLPNNRNFLIGVVVGGGFGIMISICLIVQVVGGLLYRIKSQEPSNKTISDGDDSSLESNPAYIGHLHYQRYIQVDDFKHKVSDPEPVVQLSSQHTSAYYCNVLPVSDEGREANDGREADYANYTFGAAQRSCGMEEEDFKKSDSEVLYSKPTGVS